MICRMGRATWIWRCFTGNIGRPPPAPPALAVVRSDHHTPVGLFPLAEARHTLDLSNSIVHDLALEGVHRLELHLALVERPRCHLPGTLPQRLPAALPVTLYVQRDPDPSTHLTLDRTAEQLLDGVQRLAVVTDEESRLGALHGDVHTPLPDLDARVAVDVHRFEQPVHEVQGVLLRYGEAFLLALGFLLGTTAGLRHRVDGRGALRPLDRCSGNELAQLSVRGAVRTGHRPVDVAQRPRVF